MKHAGRGMASRWLLAALLMLVSLLTQSYAVSVAAGVRRSVLSPLEKGRTVASASESEGLATKTRDPPAAPMKSEKKHETAVVTNNNAMKQELTFHLNDPERDKLESKLRTRMEEHEEKRDQKERAKKAARETKEQTAKKNRYIKEAEGKVSERQAKERRQKNERAKKNRPPPKRRPPPPSPPVEEEIIDPLPQLPPGDSIAFPNPGKIQEMEEVPGLDDSSAAGSSEAPEKPEMVPADQPDPNKPEGKRKKKRNGALAGEEEDEFQAEGATTQGGQVQHGAPFGTPFGSAAVEGQLRVGGGTWDVLPFRGNKTIWQLFGDTCFARGVGKHYYVNTGGMHEGVDFGMPCGTPVYAVCNGTVYSAGKANPFGSGPQSVILDCGDKYAKYGHLSEVTAVEGSQVTAGARLGRSGTPDSPTNCHLHFEVRPNTGPLPRVVINPATCFTRKYNHYFYHWMTKLRQLYCSTAAGHTFDLTRAPPRPDECQVQCPPEFQA